MMLKKSKEEVLTEIGQNVASVVSNEFYRQGVNLGGLNINGMHIPIQGDNFQYTIQVIIAEAVKEGFKTLLNNRYTDDDFETDNGEVAARTVWSKTHIITNQSK